MDNFVGNYPNQYLNQKNIQPTNLHKGTRKKEEKKETAFNPHYAFENLIQYHIFQCTLYKQIHLK